jgi:DNA-binding transcriptional regulator YdaS (Cro superfamily)
MLLANIPSMVQHHARRCPGIAPALIQKNIPSMVQHHARRCPGIAPATHLLSRQTYAAQHHAEAGAETA